MRSFALMAVLAVYSSAVQLNNEVFEDDSIADNEEIDIAVDDEITADVSDEADAAAEEDAEVEENNEEAIAIAASIDEAFDKVEELGAPDSPSVSAAPEIDEEDYVEPDNTRPPPE